MDADTSGENLLVPFLTRCLSHFSQRVGPPWHRSWLMEICQLAADRLVTVFTSIQKECRGAPDTWGSFDAREVLAEIVDSAEVEDAGARVDGIRGILPAVQFDVGARVLGTAQWTRHRWVPCTVRENGLAIETCDEPSDMMQGMTIGLIPHRGWAAAAPGISIECGMDLFELAVNMTSKNPLAEVQADLAFDDKHFKTEGETRKVEDKFAMLARKVLEYMDYVVAPLRATHLRQNASLCKGDEAEKPSGLMLKMISIAEEENGPHSLQSIDLRDWMTTRVTAPGEPVIIHKDTVGTVRWTPTITITNMPDAQILSNGKHRTISFDGEYRLQGSLGKESIKSPRSSASPRGELPKSPRNDRAIFRCKEKDVELTFVPGTINEGRWVFGERAADGVRMYARSIRAAGTCVWEVRQCPTREDSREWVTVETDLRIDGRFVPGLTVFNPFVGIRNESEILDFCTDQLSGGSKVSGNSKRAQQVRLAIQVPQEELEIFQEQIDEMGGNVNSEFLLLNLVAELQGPVWCYPSGSRLKMLQREKSNQHSNQWREVSLVASIPGGVYLCKPDSAVTDEMEVSLVNPCMGNHLVSQVFRYSPGCHLLIFLHGVWRHGIVDTQEETSNRHWLSLVDSREEQGDGLIGDYNFRKSLKSQLQRCRESRMSRVTTSRKSNVSSNRVTIAPAKTGSSLMERKTVYFGSADVKAEERKGQILPFDLNSRNHAPLLGVTGAEVEEEMTWFAQELRASLLGRAGFHIYPLEVCDEYLSEEVGKEAKGGNAWSLISDALLSSRELGVSVTPNGFNVILDHQIDAFCDAVALWCLNFCSDCVPLILPCHTLFRGADRKIEEGADRPDAIYEMSKDPIEEFFGLMHGAGSKRHLALRALFESRRLLLVFKGLEQIPQQFCEAAKMLLKRLVAHDHVVLAVSPNQETEVEWLPRVRSRDLRVRKKLTSIEASWHLKPSLCRDLSLGSGNLEVSEHVFSKAPWILGFYQSLGTDIAMLPLLVKHLTPALNSVRQGVNELTSVATRLPDEYQPGLLTSMMMPVISACATARNTSQNSLGDDEAAIVRTLGTLSYRLHERQLEQCGVSEAETICGAPGWALLKGIAESGALSALVELPCNYPQGHVKFCHIRIQEYFVYLDCLRRTSEYKANKSDKKGCAGKAQSVIPQLEVLVRQPIWHGVARLLLRGQPEAVRPMYQNLEEQFQGFAKTQGLCLTVQQGRLRWTAGQSPLKPDEATILLLFLQAGEGQVHHIALVGHNGVQGSIHGSMIESLVASGHLTHLDLSSCSNFGDDGAQFLAEAIRGRTSQLTELYLASCGIGVNGALALGNALSSGKGGQRLQTLDLWRNSLGHQGVEAIFRAAAGCRSLKCLYLGKCGVSDIHAETLIACLEKSPSLTTLDLYSNQLTDELAMRIAETLEDGSKVLRTLYITDNPALDVATITDLQEALPHMSVL
eukprot:gnl/MRDRNA2_/MRDRNA2_70507_c0_seq1.p1 gnl/MRDRNA2_/MRDRNA2_70507_c0~~gnl/MRDRNA2_/MRDRNA2_70507_c0_seq1.p1  ORF type:complete len:1641 (-),score=284.88 gnl/MRDRNA2_/MRDRNA2_70507_c0_seq1:252-4604(-)